MCYEANEQMFISFIAHVAWGWVIRRRVKIRAEAGSESFSATVEILERFQASRLAPAGLLTTSALDLGSRLCSSHRSLRSLIG